MSVSSLFICTENIVSLALSVDTVLVEKASSIDCESPKAVA